MQEAHLPQTTEVGPSQAILASCKSSSTAIALLALDLNP